jgi:hypothetical protein
MKVNPTYQTKRIVAISCAEKSALVQNGERKMQLRRKCGAADILNGLAHHLLFRYNDAYRFARSRGALQLSGVVLETI